MCRDVCVWMAYRLNGMILIFIFIYFVLMLSICVVIVVAFFDQVAFESTACVWWDESFFYFRQWALTYNKLDFCFLCGVCSSEEREKKRWHQATII